MSKQQDVRVLCRQGARELTQMETECVNGAFYLPVCTFNSITCQLDGQPCRPPGPACGS